MNSVNQFKNYVKGLKTAFIIISRPLDLDCISSGLIVAKYLESLGLKTKVIHPEKITQADKEASSCLPFFDKIEATDTRGILKTKQSGLLVMVDGGSLSQFYDAGTTTDNPPDLTVYDKRVLIDHHLTSQNLGDLNFHQVDVSSTTELVLNTIIPEEFLNRDLATLGYAGIVGDTGNFRWNFFPSTMRMTAKLLAAGADKDLILEKLYFSRSKLELEMLALAIEHTEYNDQLATAFLFLPYQFLKNHHIDENKLSALTDAFTSGVARAVEGYPRGVVVFEKERGVIKISARGSSLNNHISLPGVLAKLQGISGGHFNACGATINGEFEKVKKQLLETLRQQL